MVWQPIRARLSLFTLSANSVIAGVAIVLFFQCMHALLNPVNRVRGGINWGIVAHTAAMFSFLTIPISLDLNILSIGYINGREFPGGNGLFPGPLGYQSLRFSGYPTATFVVIALMFPLNQWLADGLLVTFVSNSVTRKSNAGYPPSCTVATLFIR